MTMRTIGQLASAANVGVETVRYYERIGLIPKPPSVHSGWRRYPDAALQVLHQIREGRQLGFRLAELAELFAGGCGSPCASLRSAARAKIVELDQRIEQLESQRERLTKLLGACTNAPRGNECEALKQIGEDRRENRNAGRSNS